ncbi:PDZ domain-containing protein [Emcibacter sp. SYSU 3D8]|uniref:S1C family serine protease n=1 Tax=Emcibacter sp. SYSU 3D8 TaxID=3133969 RepID=UPI0031FE9326
MVRRAIAFSVMALVAAGAAHAQITSESLDPPPGGNYGAPDEPSRPSYGSQPQAGQGYGRTADPANDPYADPSAGGVYDPAAGTVRGPTRLPGPGGPPAYAPEPRSAPPAYGRSAPPAYGRSAPEPSYVQGAAPAQDGQAGVGSSCDHLAAELERFRGPPDNPLLPRDEACASARAGGEPGRPNAAFRQCSDDFYRDYEQQRDEYRRCMEQDASKAEQRLEQRALTVDAARSGYGGTAPQMAGPYARPGAPGWLGVQIGAVSPQAAYRLGAEGTQGAYVLNAVLGSPAQKAGLQRGDIITGFDGEAILQPKDLQYQAERLTAGQTVRLEILRGGQREMLDVQITPRP